MEQGARNAQLPTNNYTLILPSSNLQARRLTKFKNYNYFRWSQLFIISSKDRKTGRQEIDYRFLWSVDCRPLTVDYRHD